MFVGVAGIAQVPLSDDYVVTLEEDTIYGFIQSVSESKISLAHASEKSMVVKKYKVSSLKCLVIRDTVYKSVKVTQQGLPSANIMMKEIIPGPVTLYNREVRKTTMWKPSDGKEFNGIFGKILFVEVYLGKEGQAYKVTEENFREQSELIFYDQAWIKEKFQKNAYSFSNLQQLVLDYNYLVENPDSN